MRALLVALSVPGADLESLLPDQWIAAHPEHFLKYRRDEAEAAAPCVVAVGSDAGRKPRNTAEAPEMAAVLVGVCTAPDRGTGEPRSGIMWGFTEQDLGGAAVDPTPSSPSRRQRAFW